MGNENLNLKESEMLIKLINSSTDFDSKKMRYSLSGECKGNLFNINIRKEGRGHFFNKKIRWILSVTLNWDDYTEYKISNTIKDHFFHKLKTLKKELGPMDEKEVKLKIKNMLNN